MMIEFFTLVVLVLIYGVIRLLHLASSASPPELHFKQPCSPLVHYILDTCPILKDIYLPPLLWGKSGHLQTILYAKMGRVRPKTPQGKRHYIVLPDGATMSFDVYEPFTVTESEDVILTLCVCPGIANSSEDRYIRTLVNYAQRQGYRVTVLNHLGALRTEALTAPRMFTYGGTEEFGRMVDAVLEMYPTTRLLAVGLSMGGNIVTKYLGEDNSHQQKFLCGMSICQGYEINDAKVVFLEWAHLRRLYTYVMTLHQRKILRRHYNALFPGKSSQKYSLQKVFSATALSDIDENYSSIRAGYSNCYEYYKSNSSAYYMKNLKIPMMMLNAMDDPICPPPLLKYPKLCADQNPLCLFVTTKHGGHLGYFEGGYMVPEEITWLDRIVVEYADSIKSLHLSGELTKMTAPLIHSDMNGADDTESVKL